jgi:hypothetical protein
MSVHAEEGMNGPSETPLYFRLLIRFLRPFSDFDFGFSKSVRERAVSLLALRPGARVLDAGCGPGGSLPISPGCRRRHR